MIARLNTKAGRVMAAAAAISLGCVSCDAGQAAPGSFTLTIAPDKTTPRKTPIIVGVGTHFGIGGEYGYDVGKSADALREVGFASFRDDLAWSWFDTSGKGDAQIPDRIAQFTTQSGARPLLILNHGHPTIDKGVPPRSTAAINGFADFGRRAEKTGKPDTIYEVWNEWNLLDGLKKALNDGAGKPGEQRAAGNYVTLAKRTVATMRAANPNATILVGAVGLDPNWTWTKAILSGGILKGASGFSVHLYNHCEGDLTKRTATNAIDTVQSLRPILDKVAGGKGMPVYITETGWPTASAGCPMSQAVAANNLSQLVLWTAATPWINGTWLYQLKDQGRNPAEPEDNFGLFDYDYRPKQAACTVREAVKIVKSATAWHIDRPHPDLFTLTANTPQGPVIISWTSREGVNAQLDFGDRSVRFQPLCESGGAASKVPISARPTVVHLNGRAALQVKVEMR